MLSRLPSLFLYILLASAGMLSMTAHAVETDIGLKLRVAGVTEPIAVDTDVNANRLKIHKNGITYSVVLVAPGSTNALNAKINVSGTTYAFKRYVPYSYAWQTGSYGSCSASCGGGTQTRSVWCQRSDGTTVADSFCGGGKPADSQSCNIQACAINGTCGSANGQNYPNGASSYASQGHSQCGNGSPSNTTFPAAGSSTTWTCSGQNGGSASSTCSASQQAATPSASIVYFTYTDDTTSKTVAPSTTVYMKWSSSNATGCSLNGTSGYPTSSSSVSGTAPSTPGDYQYSLVCSGPGGTSSTSYIYLTVATSYTYAWQTGSYGSCSASCGGGTQTRSVTCLRSDGTTVSDTDCVNNGAGAKPSTSQSCNTQACGDSQDIACVRSVHLKSYFDREGGGTSNVEIQEFDRTIDLRQQSAVTVLAAVSSADNNCGAAAYGNDTIVTCNGSQDSAATSYSLRYNGNGSLLNYSSSYVKSERGGDGDADIDYISMEAWTNDGQSLGGSCITKACQQTSVQWGDSSQCFANLPARQHGLQAGGSYNATTAPCAENTAGSATFRCENGVFQYVSGSCSQRTNPSDGSCQLQ